MSTKQFHLHFHSELDTVQTHRHVRACDTTVCYSTSACTVLIVFVNLARNTRNSNGGRKKAVEPWKNCERTTNRDDGNSRCSRRCSYTRAVWSGNPRVNTAACCLCFRRPPVDDEPDFSKCFRKSICNYVTLSSRNWWRLTFFLQLPCKVAFCWLKIVYKTRISHRSVNTTLRTPKWQLNKTIY